MTSAPARGTFHRLDLPFPLPTPQGVEMFAHFTGGDSDRNE
ncbi:MAG: hypothetical protein ACYDGY_09030 [Acidimicrobiales bacterium]